MNTFDQYYSFIKICRIFVAVVLFALVGIICLVAEFRCVFRTRSNICDGAFFVKIVEGKKPLTFFEKSFVVDVQVVNTP